MKNRGPFCETLAGLALLSLAGGTPMFAEGLGLGIKAGVPLTQYFETGRTGSRTGSSEYSAATRRYTVGISVERPLPAGLAIEIDALYKRMGYVGIVSFFSFSTGVRTTSAFDAKGNSWDFPVMVKRRFGRPYVAAGAVLRYVGPIRARGEQTVEDLIARTTVHTPIDTTDPSDMRKRFYPGLTVAGGIEFGHRVRLAPEFRYTRWTANIAGPGGLLRFAPNQAEMLLGVLF